MRHVCSYSILRRMVRKTKQRRIFRNRAHSSTGITAAKASAARYSRSGPGKYPPNGKLDSRLLKTGGTHSPQTIPDGVKPTLLQTRSAKLTGLPRHSSGAHERAAARGGSCAFGFQRIAGRGLTPFLTHIGLFCGDDRMGGEVARLPLPFEVPMAVAGAPPRQPPCFLPCLAETSL